MANQVSFGLGPAQGLAPLRVKWGWIVALGVVTRPAYLLVLEAAVGLLVAQAIVINRRTGVRYPLWSSVPAPKIGAVAHHGALLSTPKSHQELF